MVDDGQGLGKKAGVNLNWRVSYTEIRTKALGMNEMPQRENLNKKNTAPRTQLCRTAKGKKILQKEYLEGKKEAKGIKSINYSKDIKEGKKRSMDLVITSLMRFSVVLVQWNKDR